VRRSRIEPKSSQRSIRVWSAPQGRASGTFGETHYEFMFRDDVTNQLVPFRSRENGATVTLEPSNPEVEAAIANGLGREHHSFDLGDAVFDFLRETAQLLIAYGEAPHELVYLSEVLTEKIVGFDLVFVQPWTIRRKGKVWIQTIPEDQPGRHKGVSQVELPVESMFTFVLPPSIKRYFRRLQGDLESLATLSPTFAMPDPAAPRKDTGFNFTEWHRGHDLALAQATREPGWDVRRSFSERTTEYYSIHRFLKFEQFKLDLRNSLLEQLNTALQRLGEKLNFSGRVVVQGLPDQVQISNSQSELASGGAGFLEIIKPYLRS